MKIDRIQDAVKNRNIIWKKHATEKMLKRHISREELLQVIKKGEIIEEYPEDKPYPSCLILGFIDQRPVHTVTAFDSVEQIVYIITAYEPSTDQFESDFKTRKNHE